MAICATFQGPPIIQSGPRLTRGRFSASKKDEKWIFVNGILTTGYSFKRNCDRLARTFGRPITGIHNQT
ncbi:hypothetical protein VTO42DRAFT_2576 [Malbranchea cinnamomea]